MPPNIRRYCTNNDLQASMSTPTPVHHTAASRRLGKLRVDASLSSSTPYQLSHAESSQADSNASPDILSSSSSPYSQLSSLPSLQRSDPIHNHPFSPKHGVQGLRFDVNFDHIYRQGTRLQANRLGYAVKHKSLLEGGREPSSIWSYGVMEYNWSMWKI